MTTLPNAPLSVEQPMTVKIDCEPYSQDPRKAALRYVDIKVVRGETELGKLHALHIRRHMFKNAQDFIGNLDAVSAEMYEFVMTVFDECGHLRKELVEDDYLKGTGVWGRELDNDGPLLYVEYIAVQEEFRKSGVASLLLQTLAESEYTTPQTFTFLCPTLGFSAGTRSAWAKQTPADAALSRKHHYRRVGRTRFLAYTSNPTHPSRLLALEDDVEWIGKPFQSWSPHTSSGPRAANAWLHRMIESTAQSPGLPTSMGDIADVIRHAYHQDPALVREPDDRIFTPLDTAANAVNLRAIEALLSLPVESGIWKDAYPDTTKERSAVELCQHHMLSLKHLAETQPGQQWNGHSPDALRAEFLLTNAEEEEIISLSEEAYIASRKWGCTCGQCTDGWLSKRMRYRMWHGAAVDAGIMNLIVETAPSGAALDEEFAAQHLPSTVRRGGITKSMFQDYADVVRTISEILGQLGTASIPSIDNVHRALGGLGKRFFAEGGRVEHALCYVLHGAKAQSPLGDNKWDALQEGLAMEGDTGAVAYKAMPRCYNDLEFTLVGQRLGLPHPGHLKGKYAPRTHADGW